MNRTAAPPTPIRARHTLSRSNCPVGKLAKIPSVSDIKEALKESRRTTFSFVKQKSLRFSENLEAPPFERSKSMSHLQTKTPLKSILKNKNERPVISTKHLSMRNLDIDDDTDDLDQIFEAAASKESMEQQIKRLEEELKAAKEQLVMDVQPTTTAATATTTTTTVPTTSATTTSAVASPKSPKTRRNLLRMGEPSQERASVAGKGGIGMSVRHLFQKRVLRNDKDQRNNNTTKSAKKSLRKKIMSMLFGRKAPKSADDTNKPQLRKTKSVSNIDTKSEEKFSQDEQQANSVSKRTQLRKARSLKMNKSKELNDMEEVKRSLLEPMKGSLPCAMLEPLMASSPDAVPEEVEEDMSSNTCKSTSLLIGNQTSFKGLSTSEHSMQSSFSSSQYEDSSSVFSKESVKTSNKKKKTRRKSLQSADDKSVSSKSSSRSKSSRSRSRKSKGDWDSAHSNKVSATLSDHAPSSHDDDDASSTYESCFEDFDASFSLSEENPHLWSHDQGKVFVELDIRQLSQGGAKSLTHG